MHDDGAPAGIAGVAALIGTLLGSLLWASILMGPWRLGSGLLDARDHLQRAERFLGKGAIKDARYETLAGVAAADRARVALESSSPLLDLFRAAGPVDAAFGEVEHLVDAIGHSSRAAEGSLAIAQGALRGKNRIVAEDETGPGSTIRIERVRELGEVISEVREDVRATERSLAAVEPSNLPLRTRKPLRKALKDARDAEAILADAEAGFAILPGFLGADGPRSYLLGFQNPDELRGTGGSILRFAELRIDNGKPHLAKGGSVYKIDQNRTTFDIPLPADAWYVREIPDAQRFGNANWSPDWPLSSKLTIAYGRRAATEFEDTAFPSRVDGVIGVDPLAVEALMPGAGAYKLAGYGNRITADKVLFLVLYKAYATYPIAAQRRAVLTQVVDGFYEGLIDPAHPSDLVAGFGDALARKHMQIWLAHPDEQDFIERMNWDAAIEPAKKRDYLYVVEQNVGGNKFDYFDEQTTDMSIGITGRDADVSTRVTIEHAAFFPQPRWVLGDSALGADETKTSPPHRPMVNVYVPDQAELQLADVEGTRLDSPEPAVWPSEDRPAEHTERGKKVWSATLDIPPGEEGTVRFDYRVPGVVRSVGRRKVYRLVVQHQPKVRPETLTVRLQLPPDARAVKAAGWERTGDVLVWSNPLREDRVLEVSWRE